MQKAISYIRINVFTAWPIGVIILRRKNNDLWEILKGMKLKHRMMLVVILMVCVAGCSSRLSRPISGERVNHIVLCWLKEPGNITHRQKIIEVSESFRKIERVVEVRVGEVIPSDREIVDDSFDVGIFISLANSDAMNGYLNHPIHTKAVEEVLRPLARKIVVYDFVE